MKKNKHGLSRNIPLTCQEQVRKDSGYGCAICGEIFVELHHFKPEFEDATSHLPEGIIALCPNHHRLAHQNGISISELEKYKIYPFAKRDGFVSSELQISDSPPQITFGSNVFRGSVFSIFLDYVPVIWVVWQKGLPPLLNAIFRDGEFNPILSIKRNVITVNRDDVSVRKVSDTYYIKIQNHSALEIKYLRKIQSI